MNATSILNSTVAQTVPSTTTAFTPHPTMSHLPSTPRTPDGFLNVTVGPWILTWPVANKVNSTCYGNVYRATRTCCDRLGGILNSTTVDCDAECCQRSPSGPGGLNGTCPNGEFKYPICYLPTHMSDADWNGCYLSIVRELQRQNVPVTDSFGCRPPSAGVQHAVPVTLGFIAALAVSVLSM